MSTFDAWEGLAVIGGAGALSYLAASPNRSVEEGGQKAHSLRLSIDKGQSLVGDVRFLGGALTGLASAYWAKDAKTKGTLQVVALASFASLLSTELVRQQLKKSGKSVAKQLPISPNFTQAFGAMPANQGAQRQGWGQ